jgi:hypothetical protein
MGRVVGGDFSPRFLVDVPIQEVDDFLAGHAAMRRPALHDR